MDPAKDVEVSPIQMVETYLRSIIDIATKPINEWEPDYVRLGMVKRLAERALHSIEENDF